MTKLRNGFETSQDESGTTRVSLESKKVEVLRIIYNMQGVFNGPRGSRQILVPYQKRLRTTR